MSKEVPCPKCGNVWLWADWKEDKDASCPKGHGCAKEQEARMSEAPKEVWCKPYLGYDYVEDWLDGSWSSKNKGGERYIRADRIEELEAKLKIVVEDKVDVVVKITKLQTYLEDFFTLLDKTEETDDGRVFRPNRITSCRAQDGEKLNQVLLELKIAMEN